MLWYVLSSKEFLELNNFWLLPKKEIDKAPFTFDEVV